MRIEQVTKKLGTKSFLVYKILKIGGMLRLALTNRLGMSMEVNILRRLHFRVQGIPSYINYKIKFTSKEWLLE